MDIDPRLIEAYYSGNCSEEDKILVEKWLAAGAPKNDYPVRGIKNRNALRDDLWNSISIETVQTAVKAAAPRFYVGKQRLKIAASLVGVFFVAMFFMITTRSNREISYREISAPYGKQTTVTLKDCTIVMLNAGSSFRYPENFDDTIRKVFLKGEAYFSVARDSTKPFIIETRRTRTRVLGTQFNLRDFGSEAQASITLKEGSVSFSEKSSNKTVNLAPNFRAVLSGGNLKINHVSVDSFPNWKEGSLDFDNVPLAEAMAEVERLYALHVKLESPALGKLRIKGSFKKMPVGQLMEDISFLLNTKYRTQKNTIIIYK